MTNETEWQGSLSPDERIAFAQLRSNKININRHVCGDPPLPFESGEMPPTTTLIATIDGALARYSTAFAITVYCGVEEGDRVRSLIKDNVYSYCGYISATDDRGTAAKFARRSTYRPVILEFNLPSGTNGAPFLTCAHEPEFLVPRGGRYRVTNCRTEKLIDWDPFYGNDGGDVAIITCAPLS